MPIVRIARPDAWVSGARSSAGVLTDALSDVLLSGTETVAAVAERVGYRSEAAFSRAFKKVVGTPPSQWRSHRAGESARISH